MAIERGSPWRRLSPWAWLLAGVLVVLAVHHHGVTVAFEHPVAYGEGVTALWATTDGPRYPAIDRTTAAVHNPYPPLGYLVADASEAVTGDPFVALRVLAVLGMVVMAVALAACVPAGNGRVAVAGCVAMVVLSPLWWRYGSLGRFDAIACAASLGALAIGLRGGRWWWLAVVVGGCAVAIKPTYLAGAVTAVVALGQQRRWWLPAAIGVALAPLALALLASGGGWWQHLVVLNALGADPGRAVALMAEFVARHPVLAVATGTWIAVARGWQDPRRIYVLVAVVGVAACLKTGADANYLLECSTAGGVSLAALLDRYRERLSDLVPGLLLLQLLLYLPLAPAPVFTATYGQEVQGGGSALTPSAADREIGAVIHSEIEASDGPILSDDIGYLVAAGRPVRWQPYQFEQLRRAGRWDDARLLEDLRDGRIALVILRHGESWFSPAVQDLVAERYALRREVGPYRIYAPQLGF